MIFSLEYIPIIYNENYGYIIRFNDLEYINEYYGLDYNDGIQYLLEENEINEYVVAIDHWKIINNPEVVNELGNIIIIPQSENSFEYKYVKYLLEIGEYSENYNLFLNEAFDQHLYYENFLIHEGIIGSKIQDIRKTVGGITQGAINGIQSYGQNIRSTAGNIVNGIRTDYNTELSSITNGNNPTLKDKVTAGSNLAKSTVSTIGQIGKNKLSTEVDNIKNEYQDQIDRAQNISGTVGNKIKAKTIGQIVGRRIKKGASKVLDIAGSIPDTNGTALDMMSDIFIPSPEFKIPAYMLRHSREIGIATQLAKARSSQIIASLERQLGEKKSQLSRTFGNAKIELQNKINSLENKIKEMKNSNGN